MVLIYLFAPILVRIFATGFTAEKVIFTANLMRILSVTVIFSSLSGLMISALNANLFMSTTYTVALITPALNNITLIFFAGTHGLYALISSMVIGSVLSFSLLFIYHFKKLGWKFSNPYRNSNVIYLLKKNLPTRAGHIVHYLKGPLTTNVLSYFPTGYITLYSYADRILMTLFRVTNSPVLQILYAKSSALLANRQIIGIKEFLISTLKSNLILFVVVILPVVLLFKLVFGFLLISKISPDEISTMFKLFLALIPFYLAHAFELPFTYVTIAMKKGSIVLRIALVSIILYGLFLVAGIKILDLFIVPVALTLTQIYNTAAYIKFVDTQIHVFNAEVKKFFTIFSIFGILLVCINMFFDHLIINIFYLNLFLIVMFGLINGKDFLFVLYFITKKGEIK